MGSFATYRRKRPYLAFKGAGQGTKPATWPENASNREESAGRILLRQSATRQSLRKPIAEAIQALPACRHIDLFGVVVHHGHSFIRDTKTERLHAAKVLPAREIYRDRIEQCARAGLGGFLGSA